MINMDDMVDTATRCEVRRAKGLEDEQAHKGIESTYEHCHR
jgi:hypothetical protein